jgi:hypothetical protein
MSTTLASRRIAARVTLAAAVGAVPFAASQAGAAPASVADAPNLSWCSAGYACYFQKSGQYPFNYLSVLEVAGNGTTKYVSSEAGMNDGTTGMMSCAIRDYGDGNLALRVPLTWHQVKEYSLRTHNAHKWVDPTPSGCPYD